MPKLIMGAFENRDKANEAIRELEEAGVPMSDFSLIMEDQSEKTGNFRETLTETAPVKTAEGVASGGAVVGGLAGLIAGAIATAGMFVAGPVVLLAGLGWVALSTITGGAVGAAAGGIVGALIGLGVPDEAAKQHEAVIKKGGVLVGVQDNKVTEQAAHSILERCGAEQIVSVPHGDLPATVTAA